LQLGSHLRTSRGVLRPFNTLRRVVPVATSFAWPGRPADPPTFNTLRRVVPVATSLVRPRIGPT